MLGFPIRTPPDQRLVANSPGLIAGSNVLHRLLMPRHPPCALHSLSRTNTQQKQQTNTTTNHSTTGSITMPSLSALRRPRTHQHPKGAYKVCAFLLNKMLASTIQLSTPNTQAHAQDAGQPTQPHPHTTCASSEGGTETTTQPTTWCVIPQGPTVCHFPTNPPATRFHAQPRRAEQY